MKRIVTGILAHVDAGKTTLSEALLYKTGEIGSLGRVDHGTSFLDSGKLERSRGITIFSKQAQLSWKDMQMTILDTPGHVDFVSETERTLPVLDYAILLISAGSGIQSHTETLWKLLKRNRIPAFIFMNKMDLSIHKKSEWIDILQDKFGNGFTDFSVTGGERFIDSLTLGSEKLMEMVLEDREITDSSIAEAVRRREVFPVFFGSALKTEGVSEFLDGLARFTLPEKQVQEFGARVYKIARDENDVRLTFMKITGGALQVREKLQGTADDGGQWEEKVNEIRLYSGQQYRPLQKAGQGMIVAAAGLSQSHAGDGYGREKNAHTEILEPFLTYTVVSEDGTDYHTLLQEIRELAEEDPKLHVSWKAAAQEIRIRMMGQVQLEVLAQTMQDRFGRKISFSSGRILYKETIACPSEGVGHFEPLRHYAEVHLLLEPMERGSGLSFQSSAPVDQLNRNWQSQIMAALQEYAHVGVLTGSLLTDMKITLVSGKASKKHTEGGDFRQAALRAVRNGLMKTENVLLEPWFRFRIELPTENVGRAMTDLQKMKGTFQPPDTQEGQSILTGRGPAGELMLYQEELTRYSRGAGHIRLQLDGYDICHNTEEVMKDIGYDPLRDVENTPDSVFCMHGESSIIPWDEVDEYMHLPSILQKSSGLEDDEDVAARVRDYENRIADDAELMAIFERTYGEIGQDRTSGRNVRMTAAGSGISGVRMINADGTVDYGYSTKETGREPDRDSAARDPEAEKRAQQKHSHLAARKKEMEQRAQTYVIVDGYNVLHNWDNLEELCRIDYGAARQQLLEILCNYQGFMQCRMAVIFDAYKVKGGGAATSTRFHDIDVIYTSEDQTADSYIERMTRELAGKYQVRVVTSDSQVQQISLGHGALRTSSREFQAEVRSVEDAIRRVIGKESS